MPGAYIIYPTEIKTDSQVGGKAASLAALHHSELVIPAWFVLSTAAFYDSLADSQRSALETAADSVSLLALLAGLDEPTSGEVWLNGVELGRLDEDGRADLRNREVGFVFQSFHLMPSLTAIEMNPGEIAGDGLSNIMVGARDNIEFTIREAMPNASWPRQAAGAASRSMACLALLSTTNTPTSMVAATDYRPRRSRSSSGFVERGISAAPSREIPTLLPCSCGCSKRALLK